MERWRKIPGFAETYEASSTGRIRARAKTASRVMSFGMVSYDRKERILKCNKPSPKGYLRHRIEGGTWFAHRLVAMAWIPNPMNFPQVNHKNGVKRDNAPSNLEWVTNQQNRDHAVALGIHAKGERAGGAKLTKEKVDRIRAYATTGLSQGKIAAMFGVCQQTISCIVSRRSWVERSPS